MTKTIDNFKLENFDNIANAILDLMEFPFSKSFAFG